MITAVKREKWVKHLEDWKKSGLSVSKYSLENDINQNSFRYWIDRERGKIKTEKKFVKLNIQKPLSVNKSKSLSLKFRSYEIDIPTEFNKGDLETLLTVLESRTTCL